MTATLAPPPIVTKAPGPAPRQDEDPDKNLPTILSVLSQSTREERAADPETSREAARGLWRIMNEAAIQLEPIYGEADENWRFFNGIHHSYASAALNAPVILPEPAAKTIRVTLNYIRRAVERQVSILLKDPPMPRCLAGSAGIVDEMASEAGDIVVGWRQRRSELAGDAERVNLAKAISGFCWVHSEWDDTTGPEVGTGKFNILGDDGQPMPQEQWTPQTVPQGDFNRDILTHRQGVWDPSASHLFGGSYFFVRKELSRFDFANAHPDLDIDEFPPESDEKMKKVSELGRGMQSSQQTAFSTGESEAKDKLEVDICYVPKCASLPRGARIMFTREAIVEETDNPRYPREDEPQEREPNKNEEPWHPCFPFIHMVRINSAAGYSPIHDAIPCNKGINGYASMAFRHGGQLSAAKVKVPHNLAQEWADTVQVFKVPPRGFDHNSLGYLTPPQMPPEYISQWRELKNALYEFMGLNQPTIGQNENPNDSGYKIRLQQQVSDNDLETVRSRDNAMWAAVYEYELLLFRRHADTKRQIDVVGGNKAVQLKEFDRTSLTAGTRVYCANDSFLPRDPQAKMTAIQRMMGTKIFEMQDAKLRQKLIRLFDKQDFLAFEESEEADRSRAKRQILKIMNGQEPGGIADWDDHLVQMDVIREHALAEDFEAQVEAELMASMQPGAPPVPAAPGAPPPMPGAPPQPTSATFQRLTALYNAHKTALEQQQMAMAPPAPPPGAAPPAQPAPAKAAA